MTGRVTAAPVAGVAASQSAPIGLQPRPVVRHEAAAPEITVAAVEQLLENWFGRPVLLLASGRSGIFLLLQYAGLVRHRNTVQIARFHSRCVINSLTHSAMPVLAPEHGDACLLYHQFGFPQQAAVSGFVIEDLAHAFFAAPGSGEREWSSEFAIFSLPKFFGLHGAAGGIIARTRGQIDGLRELLHDFPQADDRVRAWMRRIWVAALEGGRRGDTDDDDQWLDSMYELLFRFPGPDPLSLAGLPESSDALVSAGSHRAQLVRTFLSHFDQPSSMLWPRTGALPYALPFFPRDEQRLPAAKAALEEIGVSTGDYHVDVRRDMNNPDYRRGLLVPAHHQVPFELFDAACQSLSRFA